MGSLPGWQKAVLVVGGALFTFSVLAVVVVVWVGLVGTGAPRADPPTATPIPLAPPVLDILGEYRALTTDAQEEAYLEKLIGTMAQDWEGWVGDVKHQTTGEYLLYIDVDPPDELFSTYDVVVEVPASEALMYNRDQHVRFSGVVDYVSIVLGSLHIELRPSKVVILTK